MLDSCDADECVAGGDQASCPRGRVLPLSCECSRGIAESWRPEWAGQRRRSRGGWTGQRTRGRDVWSPRCRGRGLAGGGTASPGTGVNIAPSCENSMERKGNIFYI